MAAHFTYLDWIVPPATEAATNFQKLLFAVLVASLLLLLGKKVSGILSDRFDREAVIVPPERPTLFSFTDLLMESFVKYHDSVLGKANRIHAPFTASIFFFVFILNVISLVPGMPSSTTSVWINLGIALVVYAHFNIYGVRAHGLKGYLKHFMGPIWWLAPFYFSLELLSTLMRVFTLNLRLYWNISADHIVLNTFVDLLSPAFIMATPFYFLGLFVSFMQAFVFATLTMVYILLATQHEHEEHAH